MRVDIIDLCMDIIDLCANLCLDMSRFVQMHRNAHRHVYGHVSRNVVCVRVGGMSRHVSRCVYRALESCLNVSVIMCAGMCVDVRAPFEPSASMTSPPFIPLLYMPAFYSATMYTRLLFRWYICPPFIPVLYSHAPFYP